MSEMNRLHTATNPYQGESKRVLCVCSAGLLRSPTAARVLAQEFDCNTRSAGVHSYALIPVDRVLLHWAQEIVCMTREHESELRLNFPAECFEGKTVHVLDVPDNFAYMQPQLVELIVLAYRAVRK